MSNRSTNHLWQILLEIYWFHWRLENWIRWTDATWIWKKMNMHHVHVNCVECSWFINRALHLRLSTGNRCTNWRQRWMDTTYLAWWWSTSVGRNYFECHWTACITLQKIEKRIFYFSEFSPAPKWYEGEFQQVQNDVLNEFPIKLRLFCVNLMPFRRFILTATAALRGKIERTNGYFRIYLFTRQSMWINAFCLQSFHIRHTCSLYVGNVYANQNQRYCSRRPPNMNTWNVQIKLFSLQTPSAVAAPPTLHLPAFVEVDWQSDFALVVHLFHVFRRQRVMWPVDESFLHALFSQQYSGHPLSSLVWCPAIMVLKIQLHSCVNIALALSFTHRQSQHVEKVTQKSRGTELTLFRNCNSCKMCVQFICLAKIVSTQRGVITRNFLFAFSVQRSVQCIFTLICPVNWKWLFEGKRERDRETDHSPMNGVDISSSHWHLPLVRRCSFGIAQVARASHVVVHHFRCCRCRRHSKMVQLVVVWRATLPRHKLLVQRHRVYAEVPGINGKIRKNICFSIPFVNSQQST